MSSHDSKTQQNDPTAIWWGHAQNTSPPPPVAPSPINTGEPWRWRYSPLFGVMYGPVPVGLIIAIPVLIALWC